MKMVDYTPRVRLLCEGAAQQLVDLIARIENAPISVGEFSEAVLAVLTNVYQLRRYAVMGAPAVVPENRPPRSNYEFPFGVCSETGEPDHVWLPLFQHRIGDIEFPLYCACEVLFTRDEERWRLWRGLSDIPADIHGAVPFLREAQGSFTGIVALMNERKIRLQLLDEEQS